MYENNSRSVSEEIDLNYIPNQHLCHFDSKL